MAKRIETPPQDDVSFAFGVAEKGDGTITARKAGGLSDLELCVSPSKVAVELALRNMAKAFNLAIKDTFLETPLDRVYRAARVRQGSVRLIHKDYIGLGDGIFASIGKAAQSVRLTLRGPDPASPEGEAWIQKNGKNAFGGVLNLIGRKLNLLQEFEDMVPMFVEQTLDRLEARRVVTEWNRDEWNVTTSVIGLEVVIEPKETPATKGKRSKTEKGNAGTGEEQPS